MSSIMLVRLDCASQNYAWGKLGQESKVANFGVNACKNFVSENKPYAELWMGTHTKGPSKIYSSGENLSAYLATNRTALGTHLEKVSPSNQQDVPLPFLFKVLSVNQALSVQVHPSKDQAKILHANDPKNYPDNNHKPEMAIALTPFEMMCGFRPIPEIIHHLETVKTLASLVGESNIKKLKEADQGNDAGSKAALKSVFSSFMGQPEEVVKAAVSELNEWVEKNENIKIELPLLELIKRLSKAFPGDIGVFAPFFLNYFKLNPGEVTFLGPNEPHAYLLGDCIECMACSDNTIRAGLTPKFKDIKNLCELLTYRTGTPDDNKMTSKPDSRNDNVTLYLPPVDDFAVRKVAGAAKGQVIQPPSLTSPSIIIFTEGSARTASEAEGLFEKGMVYMCPANCPIKWTVENGPFVFYEAFWNVGTGL